MHKPCIVLPKFCIQNRSRCLHCTILRQKYNHARSSSELSLPPYLFQYWNQSYPTHNVLHGRGYASRIVKNKNYKLKQKKSCLITKKDLSLWLTVSTSKSSSSMMLKRLSSTRWGVSHMSPSFWQYSHIGNYQETYMTYHYYSICNVLTLGLSSLSFLNTHIIRTLRHLYIQNASFSTYVLGGVPCNNIHTSNIWHITHHHLTHLTTHETHTRSNDKLKDNRYYH